MTGSFHTDVCTLLSQTRKRERSEVIRTGFCHGNHTSKENFRIFGLHNTFAIFEIVCRYDLASDQMKVIYDIQYGRQTPFYTIHPTQPQPTLCMLRPKGCNMILLPCAYLVIAMPILSNISPHM